MQDTSWIRAYNNKGVYTAGVIYSNNYVRGGNTYMGFTNEIRCDNDLHILHNNANNLYLTCGGGRVGIGTESLASGYRLTVNGSEWLSGSIFSGDHIDAANHMYANGFRHRSHNSNDAVLLAGGGYSQGVPVRYWAIY